MILVSPIFNKILFSSHFSFFFRAQAVEEPLFSRICREIRTKFNQKFTDKMRKFDAENETNRKSIIHSRKNVDDFWLKF